ncbi:MAG: ferritin family protein [Planctomycetota bacterium]
MSRIYNADEVYEMGEQIERDGRSFYLQAAENADSVEVKELLTELADMEKDHEQLFHDMRMEVRDSGVSAPTFDPDQQAPLYLQATAETHVFNIHKDVCDVLTGEETTEEILTTAIAFEKDTVVFFLGLKDLVPEDLGEDKINWLVEQEMEHITTLAGQLRSIKG